MKRLPIFITGCAGFIGSSLAKKLISRGLTVIGVDNLNTAYNPGFKTQNLEAILDKPQFTFYKLDILNQHQLEKIFMKHRPHMVIHLAALTGIRASLKKPREYENVNVKGTKIVFETAAQIPAKLFIFSSSSSIYGNKNQTPFKEQQTPHPNSPYAKTKTEAEKLLKKLSQDHKLPTTILRLFSVYGPHGRPDMAPYLFTEAAFSKMPVNLFGKGTTSRDYTYIDDVVTAFEKVIKSKPTNQILNIGNSHPILLTNLISLIEDLTKRKINLINKPLIKAEALKTFADISAAQKVLHWSPKIEFAQGMKKFIHWYKTARLTG